VTALRLRREPPVFRAVTVAGVTWISPRMVRVTLAGVSLEGFPVPEPAASVRLLLPSPGSDGELVVPTWNGNEFLMADGARPVLRTFTPRRFDPDALELDVEIVVHGGGAASTWAAAAAVGAPAALSGPGRGYTIDSAAPSFLVAGDETALPAISQLLDVLPTGVPVQVHVEVADPAAQLPPDAEGHLLPAGVAPGDALVAAVVGTELDPDTRVWVAGEAAAVQRIRKHLFQERGFPRSQTSIRGYWKHGRAGGEAD